MISLCRRTRSQSWRHASQASACRACAASCAADSQAPATKFAEPRSRRRRLHDMYLPVRPGSNYGVQLGVEHTYHARPAQAHNGPPLRPPPVPPSRRRLAGAVPGSRARLLLSAAGASGCHTGCLPAKCASNCCCRGGTAGSGGGKCPGVCWRQRVGIAVLSPASVLCGRMQEWPCTAAAASLYLQSTQLCASMPRL